ncbi:hypothetical protein UO65_0749 [Actinokineospora spheciospongiae]|uniref:DUF5709 domain-containing protein n=1 Tax=Actinokineospora spheciospongiae TaxID=909613 RepID=W7JD38_9PSEU|nr:hypothetical protein [Actinokineospora spheciospongiae]EWC63919.1 hypothetical protein UO65_0749 [Actinokineospora spheciospongiae]
MSTDGERPESLSQQESLDEDNLRLDPLEEGIEPPERWAEANRFGTTAREQREGEDLDHRLAAEEPDVSASATRPGADTPLSRLDDRIDERAYDGEGLEGVDRIIGDDELPPPEVADPVLARASSRGQLDDEAGGSVAASLREESAVPYDDGDRSPDAAVRGELR